MVERAHRARGEHLRLVSASTPPSEKAQEQDNQTLQQLVDATLTAPATDIGPYEQALATLTLAVIGNRPDLFEPQLRILHYCSFTRDQLADLMSLISQIHGPSVDAHMAGVIARYETIWQKPDAPKADTPFATKPSSQS